MSAPMEVHVLMAFYVAVLGASVFADRKPSYTKNATKQTQQQLNIGEIL